MIRKTWNSSFIYLNNAKRVKMFKMFTLMIRQPHYNIFLKPFLICKELFIKLIQLAMRLMGQTFVGIMRVHVQMIMSVLATSFAGSVAKTSLKALTAAENPIPAMKIIQALRHVALTCTNVILTKETVKMTVTVLEFSYVAITIVETIFQMGQIVVNNQVPRKEVSFWIIPVRIQRSGYCSIMLYNCTYQYF